MDIDLRQFNTEWLAKITSRFNEYNKILEENDNDLFAQLEVYLLVKYRDAISCTASTKGFRNILYSKYYAPAILALGIDETVFEPIKTLHNDYRNTASHDTMVEAEIKRIITELRNAQKEAEDIRAKFEDAYTFLSTYIDPVIGRLAAINKDSSGNPFQLYSIRPFENGLGKDKLVVDTLYVLTNEFRQNNNIGMYLGFTKQADGTYLISTYPIGIKAINESIAEYNNTAYIKKSFMTSENKYYTNPEDAAENVIRDLLCLYTAKAQAINMGIWPIGKESE